MTVAGTNSIEVLILVILGSALGGMCRFGVSGLVARRAGARFPWGTLAVNVTGSLLIGVIFALTGTDVLLLAAPPWHQLLTYGFLGGYTTFSTLSLEVFQLLREDAAPRAVLYVVATLVLGIGACVAGFFLVGGTL
jgi:fluoride exporter